MSTNPIKDRAKEPSTWIGVLAVIVGGFLGSKHPELNDPTFWGSVTAVVSGLLNIFMKEKK